MRGLENPLFLLLLAFNTMASPGDRVKAFGLDFLLAGDTEAIGRSLDSFERLVYQVEDSPIVVALMKEKLFGVGIRGLVGNILGGLFVRFSSVLLGFRYQVQQLCLFCQQSLLESFSLSLVHALPCVSRLI